MANPVFIQFETPDGLTLPGLLYKAKPGKKAVIYLHGNGSSSVFYGLEKNESLAKALAQKGISTLFFNNRGAHKIKRLKSKKGGKIEKRLYGMAYEKIKECVEDIEGAIRFLEALGYEEFHLVGASTGANKICVYDHYRPKNKVSKYVLLCGGDDVGIYYDLLGEAAFKALLSKAEKETEAGRGEGLMPELVPWNLVFSHQGFYDIGNPDGDYNVFPLLEAMGRAKLSTKPLFRYFKGLKRPTLVVYGDQDEYAWGDVQKVVGILKAQRPDFKYEIIKGANHGFDGKERALAKRVAGWLGKV